MDERIQGSRNKQPARLGAMTAIGAGAGAALAVATGQWWMMAAMIAVFVGIGAAMDRRNGLFGNQA